MNFITIPFLMDWKGKTFCQCRVSQRSEWLADVTKYDSSPCLFLVWNFLSLATFHSHFILVSICNGRIIFTYFVASYIIEISDISQSTCRHPWCCHMEFCVEWLLLISLNLKTEKGQQENKTKLQRKIQKKSPNCKPKNTMCRTKGKERDC